MHSSTPHPFVVDRDDLREDESHGLWSGAAAARSETAVIDVTGPGSADCLQGLLTADVLTAADGALQYSGLLTAKGMLVTDLWVARLRTDTLTLYVPTVGKESLLAVLTRSLPPRLARVVDRSGNRAVIRLVGPTARAVAARAQYGEIEPGRVERLGDDHLVARPETAGPFMLQVQSAADVTDSLLAQLVGAGAVTASALVLESARIMSGWPRVGAEIDDKTLPQEVRFDDLGGVSHSKGCYLGQETVARIHFRGHVNKRIVGLRWASPPDFSLSTITHGGRPAGRVTSAMWAAPAGQFVGLGMVRQEVEIGDEVVAGGTAARTAALPLHTSP